MCWLPKVQLEGERIPEKVRSSPQPWIRPTQDDKSTILFQQQHKHKDFIKLVGRNSNWQKSVTGRDYMHTAQAHYPWMIWMVFLLMKADSPLFSLWLYSIWIHCAPSCALHLTLSDWRSKISIHGRWIMGEVNQIRIPAGSVGVRDTFTSPSSLND